MQPNVRQSHWVKRNHQCRVPKRWITFDCEAKSEYHGKEEIQSWRMGAAIRWRHGLKRGDQAEAQTFDNPRAMWEWIAAYCRAGERTVAMAHNLGYDVRVSQALSILPELGFRLEWCNLDSGVSAMTWRSDNGTLVLADTWTWLPLPLGTIAPDVGLSKLRMPADTAGHFQWERYCLRDAEIAYRVVKELASYITDNDLGNWQPTGAGMAYATWRHKFMTHNVLVHDDTEALAAERLAMHTGRAEAWRHGRLSGTLWSEVDMRNAYIQIASECDLPVKLKWRSGAITNAQFHKLCNSYRVLVFAAVHTRTPVVPYHTGARTIWPTGRFHTWLWDTEVALLDEAGAEYQITDSYVYAKAPALAKWASWILSLTDKGNDTVSPVIKTWAKHCGRANIGRIALRCPTWEEYGANPEGITGISRMTDYDSKRTYRLMHVGTQTLIETSRGEGRDSLPQITGWIMAECRARLWRAMQAAGLANVAHVDTDALLVSAAGLAALRAAQGPEFGRRWQVKGSWRKVIVYSPRNYRTGDLRKASGVPRKAEEVLPNVFAGERWSGVATDLESGRHDKVTITSATWEHNVTDPRRRDAPGAGTETVAYSVGVPSSETASSSSNDG